MADENGVMTHLSTEHIITYLNGRAADTEKSTMEAHLSICAECSESRTQIQALERRLRREPRYELPADFVDSLLNLFPATAEPEKPSLRQIIASLVYDSFDQPMLAGARSPAAAPRHLIFRAGDFDVDVKLEPAGHQQITLAGQVLSSAPNFFDNAPVQVESGGLVRYRTHTNEMGEFSFEVPNDTYGLSIDLPEVQIAIFEVNSRNPAGE
jgi:anti-sigma factor RsiW